MSSFINDPKKMNRKEEEIYNILYKKKEINDKTPNFYFSHYFIRVICKFH